MKLAINDELLISRLNTFAVPKQHVDLILALDNLKINARLREEVIGYSAIGKVM